MNLKIIEFCAREVEYQGDGPLHVWWYLQAWDLALDKTCWANPIGQVAHLGHLVEPIDSPDLDWRKVNVRVGLDHKPAFQKVPKLMQQWDDDLPGMTPEEAYKSFEEIHPFVDGNGRVGKIIYNWKAETLENPTFPSTYEEDEWHKQRGFGKRKEEANDQ